MARTGPFDADAVSYDGWFEEHAAEYRAELEAVRALLPEFTRAVEIGVGTGRFAAPLGIRFGVEPSSAMARIARSRGIQVVKGVAERLPLDTETLDLVLMVTMLCFLDDVGQALSEAHRVLANGGHIVVGFLDRETDLGRVYEGRKEKSTFYRMARFLSSGEVVAGLREAGFENVETVQTIFGRTVEAGRPSPVEPGHGEGLFVVARGRRM